MKQAKSMLKKFGENMAVRTVDPRCTPLIYFQPKPPAKIQAKMHEAK